MPDALRWTCPLCGRRVARPPCLRWRQANAAPVPPSSQGVVGPAGSNAGPAAATPHPDSTGGTRPGRGLAGGPLPVGGSPIDSGIDFHFSCSRSAPPPPESASAASVYVYGTGPSRLAGAVNTAVTVVVCLGAIVSSIYWMNHRPRPRSPSARAARAGSSLSTPPAARRGKRDRSRARSAPLDVSPRAIPGTQRLPPLPGQPAGARRPGQPLEPGSRHHSTSSARGSSLSSRPTRSPTSTSSRRTRPSPSSALTGRRRRRGWMDRRRRSTSRC